ncbi:ATP-dependent 6-phosphofructokinase 3-like [Neltuma alba]|uniref:ATP-dependent 6-phosphofructokinase 3-like n=1 Tax=Neltuma alba TaxID=207710 RepID=UPI0010A3DD2D|nr:ATP-dependent 6-phosphofructokinase 3-like [Prosopis alba]
MVTYGRICPGSNTVIRQLACGLNFLYSLNDLAFVPKCPGGLDGQMVILVAEGAGQDLVSQSIQSVQKQDASGNKLLLQDVGLRISQRIKDHFAKHSTMRMNLKYIGLSTSMIRAIPNNASDNMYFTLLAQSVVHGAIAGYTGYTSGLTNGRQTYIPFYNFTENHSETAQSSDND